MVAAQGKYGGNSVNFVNGFSIPRNIFTLDFVTLVREKKTRDFKETLKKIVFVINSKTGGAVNDISSNKAAGDIDYVYENRKDIETAVSSNNWG